MWKSKEMAPIWGARGQNNARTKDFEMESQYLAI
jgi:hypothetical protein